MVNMVIDAPNIKELNKKICECNKQGWVVKQIFVVGEDSFLTSENGFYALLEQNADWK